MDYSKYYTPMDTSRVLISCLQITEPVETIDICCGSCNLLHAAKERWDGVKMTGVDLKPHKTTDVKFFNMDGRQFALQTKKRYQLVLANPPFEKMQDSQYDELYSGYFSACKSNRLENEMLLANLRILKRGGVLLAIMPSSFIEGEKNLVFRKCIANKFWIKDIIKLPEDTFANTGIRTYAVIIENTKTKDGQCNLSRMEKVDGKLVIFNSGSGAYSDIVSGLWSESCNTKMNCEEIEIYRGNISSKEFVDKGDLVLHTSVSRDKWFPSNRFFVKGNKTIKYVERGDIIVSRIGKSAGCWCKYRGDRLPISDCLLIIKDPQDTISEEIKGLDFTHLVKGVATPYITKNDVLVWYLTRCKKNVESEKESIN